MTRRRRIYGTELRYVLTFYLSQYGPASIAELVDALDYYNFEVAGSPEKSISDALRWEIGHDRVRRKRRGVYAPGYMSRSTEHRIRERVLALRDEADLLAGRDWDKWWDAMCDEDAGRD
jgi:hypothetical protein